LRLRGQSLGFVSAALIFFRSQHSGTTLPSFFFGFCPFPIPGLITALNLSISALGNVRTESLRAFSAAEMMTIVNKMI
jgi:hypothetical protein